MENNFKELEFVKKNINNTWGDDYDLEKTIIREINESDDEPYKGFYVQLINELKQTYRFFYIYKIKKTEFKEFIEKEIYFRLINMPLTISDEFLEYGKDKRFKTLDKISIKKLVKKMWKDQGYNVFEYIYDNIFTNLHYVYCVNGDLYVNLTNIFN